MREGFEVGRKVRVGKDEGVLADHRHTPGWRNPCYDGEGFYFVVFPGWDRVMIFHEDDLVLVEEA